MWRLFLWRMSFELFHLLKAVGYRGRPTYYFAYGGNLDPANMETRGMTMLASFPARVPDFKLSFGQEVPFIGMGMGSMEKSQGSYVYGMVYTIPRIDERIMDCYEACIALKRYHKGTLVIENKTVFYYFAGRFTPNLLPSKVYLQKILSGYEKMGMTDPALVSQMKKHAYVSELVPKTPPRFLITDYDRWGAWLRPYRETYDGLCVKVFLFFLYRPAFFKRWIKKPKT